MKKLAALGIALMFVSTASAGFIVEIDTDGLDDGVLTYNPLFSFGGDTTTASQSAKSNAFGMTGGDSIFGGDGNLEPDTYVYTYSPDSMADNLVIPAGQDLGAGNTGTGMVGGGAGMYRVYLTWPWTSNTAAPVDIEVTTAGDSFTTVIDENGTGHVWVALGDINYTGGAITVTQMAQVNGFVSMRAAGVLFEAIPEPSTLALLALGGLALIRRR